MSQWAEVRHLHVVEGVPKKEIARRLKLDVKTVRRAIGRPTPPVQVSPPRPGTRLAHLAPSTNRRRRRSTSTAAVSAWRTTAAETPTAVATSRAIAPHRGGRRPVVSRSSAGEDPSRHREHPSGTEPCVVVHDLDIGRT